MKKVNHASADISQDNLIKLQRVFPQFVKDNQIDFDSLKNFFDENGLNADEEKYGLNWVGKSQGFQAIRTPSIGTLTPQEKDSINWQKTQNLFIEGDNLEVLKLLQKHYREKIKMIYIDPPYNTGKDFIYKDNFKENIADYYERTGQTKGGIKLTTNTESGGRYHSDWLTMMYPRLFLAKNLLRDDGVIFISIDDNEVHNLRHLMDEIFGQENFVGSITVEGNPRGRDYGGIARMHDYLLVYSKSENIKLQSLFNPNKEFPYEDKTGKFEIRELRNRNIAFNIGNRPNLYYQFYVNPSKKDENGFYQISLEDKGKLIEVFPKESQGFKTVWRWGKQKSLKFLNTEIVAKKMGNGNYQIVEKYRKQTKMARSIWNDKEVNTEKGTLETKELFNGKKIFGFPKPVSMIKRIVEMGTEKEGIVLDFFAGSGTTAHAVMDLNAQDGGNRKWILVQLPEITDEKSEAKKAGFNTIAEIARERIRRAGKKIGKGDVGFKSYTLQKSNYRQWQILDEKADEKKLKQQMKLVLDHPLIDSYNEASVVYEVLLKEGFSLNSQVKKEKRTSLEVWEITDEDKTMLVTFVKKLTRDQIEKLGLKPEDTFVCFDSALDDTTKVNIIRNLNVKVI